MYLLLLPKVAFWNLFVLCCKSGFSCYQNKKLYNFYFSKIYPRLISRSWLMTTFQEIHPNMYYTTFINIFWANIFYSIKKFEIFRNTTLYKPLNIKKFPCSLDRRNLKSLEIEVGIPSRKIITVKKILRKDDY